MRSAGLWFLVLVAVCIVGPYLLGVRPKTKRQWVLIALTIAFAAWLLPMMIPVR